MRKAVRNISLKSLRRAKGLTQKEFAALIGVDQSSVTQWETGKTHPRYTRFNKMCEVLGCTVDELMKEEEQ